MLAILSLVTGALSCHSLFSLEVHMSTAFRGSGKSDDLAS